MRKFIFIFITLMFIGLGCDDPDQSMPYVVPMPPPDNRLAEELIQQNSELLKVQEQTIKELEAVRTSAQQAETEVKTSYLALGPISIVLFLMSASLAVVIGWVSLAGRSRDASA